MSDRMFFDLQKEITTNVDFINKVERIISDIRLAEQSGKKAEKAAHTLELLKACDGNPALLTPFFFPNFSRGKPMTMWSRPHAFAMMSMIPTGELTVQASRQVGKCVTGDTLIRCQDSAGDKTITMQDLWDSAGKPC
jgi:hypothetical protein